MIEGAQIKRSTLIKKLNRYAHQWYKYGALELIHVFAFHCICNYF